MKRNANKILLFIVAVVISVVCMAASVSALDAGGRCGDNVKWKFNSETGELIISGKGEMYDYGYDENASPFRNSNIKTVVIKNGVKSIGKCAFSSCKSLKSITIPDGVTGIGDNAFSRCTKLKKIVLPDSVTELDSWAFVECTGLKTVVIGNGVTTISWNAFMYCSSLESVTLGNSVTKIERGAFGDCTKLKNINLPDGLTTIDDSVFNGCTSLTGIKIPDSVTYMGSGVFQYCAALTEIIIPGSVAELGNSVFYECTGLKKLTIGKGVTDIIHYTFFGCTSLEEITISDSVKRIDLRAFYNCPKIKTVNYTGSEKQWKEIKIDEGSEILTKASINYFYGCKHEKLTTLKAVAATCTKAGKTTGKKCAVCGKITVKQKSTDKKAHTYKVSTTKATLNKNGKTVKKCTVCGYSKSAVIYQPKTIKLSYKTAVFDGKVKKPAVTVKDSQGKALKNGTDYTVKYSSGRKNPGKYSVAVIFKGKYKGTKKLVFTIRPEAPEIIKLTASGNNAKITWSDVAGESGYELYYSVNKSDYRKVAAYKNGVTEALKKKLTKGKTYYFKVRAYTEAADGKINSDFSSVRAVKIR